MQLGTLDPNAQAHLDWLTNIQVSVKSVGDQLSLTDLVALVPALLEMDKVKSSMHSTGVTDPSVWYQFYALDGWINLKLSYVLRLTDNCRGNVGPYRYDHLDVQMPDRRSFDGWRGVTNCIWAEERAIASTKEAIAINPQGELYYMLAQLHLRGRHWETAIEHYQKAEELGDENTRAKARVAILKAQEDAKTTSACFVATACYGSAESGPVCTLRMFRDKVLNETGHGRLFTMWYYRNGPRLARYLQKHPSLRVLCRALIVAPMASLAGWLLRRQPSKEATH